MNPFDMAVVVVIGFMTILGVFRGLIREAASIAGLLAGFCTAYFFFRPVGDLLEKYAALGTYADIVGFILLFCAAFLAVILVGALIRFLMNLAFLGVLDRILGGLFGMVKGILIVAFGYLLLVTFVPRGGGRAVQVSKLGPPVYDLSRVIVHVVPASTRDRLLKKLEGLNGKNIPPEKEKTEKGKTAVAEPLNSGAVKNKGK